MFIKDFREVERRSFPEMQLILQLLGHFAPQQLKPRSNDKNPDYEELVLATKLGTNGDFKVDYAGLAAFLQPSREMANFICHELDRGKIKFRRTHLLSPRRFRSRPGPYIRKITPLRCLYERPARAELIGLVIPSLPPFMPGFYISFGLLPLLKFVELGRCLWA